LLIYFFFDILDSIVLYSDHINPISWEILLNVHFCVISKGTELFLISSLNSLNLCFAIDINISNSFSRWLCKLTYFRISFLLFKIMKDLHLYDVLYSEHLYIFESSTFRNRAFHNVKYFCMWLVFYIIK